jgi:hypothetical protein
VRFPRYGGELLAAPGRCQPRPSKLSGVASNVPPGVTRTTPVVGGAVYGLKLMLVLSLDSDYRNSVTPARPVVSSPQNASKSKR